MDDPVSVSFSLLTCCKTETEVSCLPYLLHQKSSHSASKKNRIDNNGQIEVEEIAIIIERYIVLPKMNTGKEII